MKSIIVLFACIYLCIAEDHFEGDIVLDTHTADIVNGKSAYDAVKSDTRKWTGGVVPYVFASNFESSRQAVVRQAIAEYNKYTCIRWVPRSNQRNYVKFIVGGGCYSFVGMTGGKQDISIGQHCDKKGIVMHEMMHCMGFWHEQSRRDRDSYIRIFWENISNGRKNNNFQKYSHGEGDYYGEGYDYDSVMHYANWAFSTNDKMTIQAVNDRKKMLGQRDGFSPIDVKQLNKVYKCKGYENIKVPPVKGCIDRNAKCGDYAKWGQCTSNERYMLQYCCKTCKDKATGGGGGGGSSSSDSSENSQQKALSNILGIASKREKTKAESSEKSSTTNKNANLKKESTDKENPVQRDKLSSAPKVEKFDPLVTGWLFPIVKRHKISVLVPRGRNRATFNYTSGNKFMPKEDTGKQRPKPGDKAVKQAQENGVLGATPGAFPPADERIAFVIDASANVENSSIFDKVKNSLLQFTALHTSPKQHKLGLISFGDKPNLDLSFDEKQDEESIHDAIEDIKYNGKKGNLTRALEFAADKLFDTGLGKRQFLKEVLVMIIGGENEITERVRHIVGYLKMRGIKLFCIGVSKKPMFDATQQKILASSPSAHHVLSVTYASLPQMPSMLEKMMQGDVKTASNSRKLGMGIMPRKEKKKKKKSKKKLNNKRKPKHYSQNQQIISQPQQLPTRPTRPQQRQQTWPTTAWRVNVNNKQRPTPLYLESSRPFIVNESPFMEGETAYDDGNRVKRVKIATPYLDDQNYQHESQNLMPHDAYEEDPLIVDDTR